MKYRSAKHLECFWDASNFFVKNLMTKARISTDPIAASVLCSFSELRFVSDVAQEIELDENVLDSEVASLLSLGFLESEEQGGAGKHTEEGFDAWVPWGKEGLSFYFSTRGAPFTESTDEVREEITKDPSPPVFKEYKDADRIFLPRHHEDPGHSYQEVLYRRRTHRDFVDAPVRREVFSALMAMTFGVKDFIDAQQFGALMLRTSPAGGARHELEAYAVITGVAGIAPGIYHYNVREHSLELLQEGEFRDPLTRACDAQSGVGEAPFSVVLTSVVSRLSFKYRHPRAYRVMLMNSGHLGQTFALTATALGLGPFQTAAFNDSAVEELLGVDGVRETALYVLSAGVPAVDANGDAVLSHPPMSLEGSRKARFE
ncbi:SagB/ThcOx family dehydrogenase [Nocardiopsis sp. EMB25]|uniref:SagB/ThcOx family dehydrogenase n=1 Tax=Nocardiopsis sp. EMB25 TaxID=2835867 RepID=UPI00228526F5|nr:SagB/ThcOx family dehydrogenase [Nocardiopsis sp. EMB25]MCY9783026.1 SagB/ThcOx family dehydrogenase [Nocardiopsis sp. EMB25]